jgi:RNA polymerase sigma-70 factor (ECF subfamily)
MIDDKKSDRDLDCFPSTQWMLVYSAAAQTDEVQRRALEELLRQYMRPLRVFLEWTWHLNSHDAEDLLQGFVVDKILDRKLLTGADQRRGKFRSFLLASLNHYVIDQLRQRQLHSSRPPQAVAAQEDNPVRSFARIWAGEVIAQANRLMRERCKSSGRTDLWHVFESRVLGPAFVGENNPENNGDQTTMVSESSKQAANRLVTVKRIYRSILREIIGQYTPDADVNEEIRDLLAAASTTG